MEKLTKVQHELKVPKDKTNTFGKYKYRSCESILEKAKPILGKYGLQLLMTDEPVVIGDRYYIKSTVVLHDPESDNTASVAAYAREAETKAGMDPAQITGAASSYARKYALCGLFAIDDSDLDPDALPGYETAGGEIAEWTREALGRLEQCKTLDECKALWAEYSAKDNPKNKICVKGQTFFNEVQRKAASFSTDETGNNGKKKSK